MFAALLRIVTKLLLIAFNPIAVLSLSSANRANILKQSFTESFRDIT